MTLIGFNRLQPVRIVLIALIAIHSSSLFRSRAIADEEKLASSTASVALRPSWVVSDQIGAPAAAVYDRAAGEIYLSQIGGEGDKKDGDGLISRLDLNGRIVAFSWISGLNAPKFLAIDRRRLWVTDIDEVVGIDIDSGKIGRRIPIIGAKFLTGIAVDEKGTLYVGDMLESRIYCVKNGHVFIFAEGRELESPGALIIKNGQLDVGAWGFTTDYSAAVPGTVYSLDLNSHKKTVLSTHRGSWFGLCTDGGTGFYGADFEGGGVFHISPSGAAQRIVQLPRGSAGLVYVPEAQLLVVPETRQNRVVGYDLAPQTASK